MIDTLMALWNQDRRKRAGQVILTFLLMCIGISLLFVITNRSVQPKQQTQQASSRQVNPTIPTFGNTVIPDLTPTVSVVIGTQLTPVVTRTQPTPTVTTTQPTPIATTTQPCLATPSGATSQTSSLYTNALLQQTSSPTPTSHHGSETPVVPLKHFDGGGGGPIGTPVLLTPTPISQSTPSSGAPPGWVPNCTTSNTIGIMVSNDVLPLLLRNIWLILGSSLLGTILFYATIFVVKRRMRV